jgi:hypothetical protein
MRSFFLAVAVFWAVPALAQSGEEDAPADTTPTEESAPGEAAEPTPTPVLAPEPDPSSAPPTEAAANNEAGELNAKVDALAADLNDLRESLVVPEKEEKKSKFGLGPAASKVYGRTSGISLGGYGEFYFTHDLDEAEPSVADMYRYIQYVGYKFNDWVVMNAELEFEHATTGTNPENGKKGSVSVEFAYIDLLFKEYFNLRTGLLLVPVGIINEMHEPTTYRGNFRPEVERRIIPSTWREAGVGAFGSTPFGLSYKAYLVNGLSADGFDKKGVRGGRQKGNHVVFEDKAVALRLDYDHRDLVTVGASFYYGGADHNPTSSSNSESNGIVEAHAIARYAGAELRGLVAYSFIDVDADPDDPEDSRHEVPEEQWGFYLEGSYDILPHIANKPGMALRPFARFEMMNLRAAPEPENPSLDLISVVAGLEYNPVPDVVFKLEFMTAGDDDPATESQEEVRIGAGFIY